MASRSINISLPEELVQQIDETAQEASRTRSELIGEATRHYLTEYRWRRTQDYFSERARLAGIRTENDVEALIDSLDD